MKITIYDIIYYSICFVLFLISFIISVKNTAKQKNISKLQALYECIPNAVINAENMFGTGNGAKKKEFVMTNLINIALQSKTKYDYAELDRQVESVVKATKNVNVAVVESVNNTFCDKLEQCETVEHTVEQDEPKTTDNVVCEHNQTDGAVIVEIDKIKGDEQNGSDN